MSLQWEIFPCWALRFITHPIRQSDRLFWDPLEYYDLQQLSGRWKMYWAHSEMCCRPFILCKFSFVTLICHSDLIIWRTHTDGSIISLMLDWTVSVLYRYRSGIRGHMKAVVMDLLRQYLKVEIQFQNGEELQRHTIIAYRFSLSFHVFSCKSNMVLCVFSPKFSD